MRRIQLIQSTMYSKISYLSNCSFCSAMTWLLFLIASIGATGHVQGATVVVLEQSFVRGTGAPMVETVEFVAPTGGEGILRIINGAKDNGDIGEKVSSSVLSLNGVEVAGPEKFNQNVDIVEVPVGILNGLNILDVELRSKPGSSIFISIEGPGIPVTISTIADPTAFLTNAPSQVRFQSQILPDPELDTSSIRLFEVDDELKPVGGPLCNLLDNGLLENGDDILGDSVFSCFVDFLETLPRTIKLAVEVIVSGQPFRSSLIMINVVDPLTPEQAQVVLDGQNVAAQTWNEKLFEFGDTLEAREATAAAIRDLDGVVDAGISTDGYSIWIQYDSGANGHLLLKPEGTFGGGGPIPIGVRQSRIEAVQLEESADPPRFPISDVLPETQPISLFAASTAPVPQVGNSSVLVWEPYANQFGVGSSEVEAIFEGAECPNFSVTHLQNEQATLASVQDFSKYGTVAVFTHGGVDASGDVMFAVREEATTTSIMNNSIDIQLGRVSTCSLCKLDIGLFCLVDLNTFCVHPSFITNLSKSFESSVVYMGSCKSANNTTMQNAFLNKGVKTYFGYQDNVLVSRALSQGRDVFETMVINGMNAQEASNQVNDPNMILGGDGTIVYGDQLLNGTFEIGALNGWISSGDGRVVAKLGEFSPTEGTYMGLISTGLGFTITSGSIAQDFCLPQTATKLEFDWNFVSEEFVEWCGAQFPFDDPFEVQIVADTGTTTIFRETVDTLCGGVSSTALAFDQSGPGCVPSDGVGVGTGGNDCMVWSTGWRNQSIDISAIASANVGKGITLRFSNFDLGDSIFDSAVILDNIQVVTP